MRDVGKIMGTTQVWTFGLEPHKVAAALHDMANKITEGQLFVQELTQKTEANQDDYQTEFFSMKFVETGHGKEGGVEASGQDQKRS